MTKEVILKFDQSGGVEADALGFKGKACEETTDRLLAGLQTASKQSVKKPEFNQVDTARSSNQQRW